MIAQATPIVGDVIPAGHKRVVPSGPAGPGRGAREPPLDVAPAEAGEGAAAALALEQIGKSVREKDLFDAISGVEAAEEHAE